MKRLFLKIALVAAAVMIGGAPVLLGGGLDLPVTNINGQRCYYYKVKKGETVYGLVDKLGVSREDLIKFNRWAEDGVRAGRTLYFPVAYFDEKGVETSENRPEKDEKSVVEPTEGTRYVVQKDETLFGICHKFGLTAEQIIEANPSAEYGVEKGDVLVLPLRPDNGKKEVPTVNDSRGSGNKVVEMPTDGERKLTPVNPGLVRIDTLGTGNAEELVSGTVDAEETTDSAGMLKARQSVVLMLPFMLDEEKPNKATQQITDFYRGFLLGIDSMRQMTPPADVLVFDTGNSTERLRRLLADEPRIAEASFIIAPDNAEHLKLLAEFGKEHGSYVLNNVGARDSSYVSNPFVMQGAVPTSVMYAKAIEAFVETLGEATPIILVNENGRNDKQPFVDGLKEALALKGVVAKELRYSGSLHSAAMEEQFGVSAPGSEYVFISISGSLTEFNKFAPSLVKFKDDMLDKGGKVTLWGYPEYVTFRNDAYESLGKLNTMIYSRSYSNEGSYDVAGVNRSFGKWYGRVMVEGVPSQALLGFDTANFVMRALSAGGFDRHDAGSADWQGVQSTFRFRKMDDAEGPVNMAVYIITFNGGDNVDVKVL